MSILNNWEQKATAGTLRIPIFFICSFADMELEQRISRLPLYIYLLYLLIEQSNVLFYIVLHILYEGALVLYKSDWYDVGSSKQFY